MAAAGIPAPGRTRRWSRDEPPLLSDLRLVLVGKTGAGKSSSGNTILGRNAFRADVSHSSVSKECCKQQEQLFSRMVSVVDTPGLFDTSLDEPTVKREISKCINMSAPGPHAILLVIKVGRFTQEERDAVKQVEEIFGEDAWRYTMVLFTHGDQVKTDFDEKVKKAQPELQEILKKVGNRYHVFNNLKADDRGQVLDLLEKVDRMVAANGGQFHSNYTYQQVVEMLDQRESQLREFYQKKMEEKIKAVESEYKRKLMETQEERQQVEQRQQAELEEVRRFFQGLLIGVRYAVEQMAKEDSFDEMCSKFYQTLKLN